MYRHKKDTAYTYTHRGGWHVEALGEAKKGIDKAIS